MGPTPWLDAGRSGNLCRIREQDSTQIAFVAVTDGSVRVVKTLEMVAWQHPILALSPDGQTIAFEMAAGADHRDPGNVYLLSADGRREYVVRIGRQDDDTIDESILAILPWSPASLLGIPVGIWCLRTLYSPAVKAAFVRESLQQRGLDNVAVPLPSGASPSQPSVIEYSRPITGPSTFIDRGVAAIGRLFKDHRD